MNRNISLVVLKTGATEGTEISQLVEKIKWSGRRGSPTRTLSVTMIDDGGYRHARSGIDIEEGWHCVFSYKGEELFRGIFLRQTGSYKKTAEYKAYDTGVYLSNNKDTFAYEKKTATDVFCDVCDRFGIPTGEVAQTEYTIPDLTKKKTTGWDAIEDALSLDYENTGVRHYVFSEKGELSLKKRLDNVQEWILETGRNIASYKYTVSLEDTKTRIKLLSSKNTVLATSADGELEEKIGIFQTVQTPDESLTKAQAASLAESLLEELKLPEKTLTLSKVMGIPTVISGVGVFINIPHLNLNRTFYVDTDEHTFDGNLHTMSLMLNLVEE